MKTTRRLPKVLPARMVWRTLGALLALLLMTTTALAASPGLTGTLVGTGAGKRVTLTNPVTKQTATDFAGVIHLQLDLNTPGDRQGPQVNAFCVQINVMTRVGDGYNKGDPITGTGNCQIRYLLATYPASTATTNDEAAARQVAIWHYTDNLDLTTVQDLPVRDRAAALVAEADAAGCPNVSSTIPTMTISPPTATVGPGQPQTYTVQVTPPDAAPNVTLQINGTATFQGGGQQATLPLNQGAATFTVINGPTGPSTITASLPYQLDPGTIYESNLQPPNQRLVLADAAQLTQTAQATIDVQVVTDTPTSTAPPTGTPPTGTPPTDTPTATPPTGTPPTDTPTPPTKTPSNLITPTDTPTSETPTAIEHHDNGGGGGGKTDTPTPETATPGTPTPETATPTVLGQETITPGGPSPSAVSAGAAAGGRPPKLPRTGEPSGDMGPIALAIAALLLGGGLLLRRRRPRR